MQSFWDHSRKRRESLRDVSTWRSLRCRKRLWLWPRKSKCVPVASPWPPQETVPWPAWGEALGESSRGRMKMSRGGSRSEEVTPRVMSPQRAEEFRKWGGGGRAHVNGHGPCSHISGESRLPIEMVGAAVLLEQRTRSSWRPVSSVQSRPTLCDPMDCSTPGFPVHHQLLELAQTHVRWVSDPIQPSHPLSSPSPLAFNLSQHQGLFQEVSYSHHMAKILEFQLQHQSFQWIIRTDFLEDWLVWPPWYSKNSQESSPKLQFKSIYSSVLSFLYGPTLTSIHDHWKSHNFDYSEFGHKVMLLLFSMLSSFVIVFLPRASVF